MRSVTTNLLAYILVFPPPGADKWFTTGHCQKRQSRLYSIYQEVDILLESAECSPTTY